MIQNLTDYYFTFTNITKCCDSAEHLILYKKVYKRVYQFFKEQNTFLMCKTQNFTYLIKKVL